MSRFLPWNLVNRIPDGLAFNHTPLLTMFKKIPNITTRALPLLLIPILNRYHLQISPSDDRRTELDLIPVGTSRSSNTSPG